MLAEPYINNSEVPLHSPGQLRRVTFSDSHHVSQYEQPACSGDDSELGLSLLGKIRGKRISSPAGVLATQATQAYYRVTRLSKF